VKATIRWPQGFLIPLFWGRDEGARAPSLFPRMDVDMLLRQFRPAGDAARVCQVAESRAFEAYMNQY